MVICDDLRGLFGGAYGDKLIGNGVSPFSGRESTKAAMKLLSVEPQTGKASNPVWS
jgi:hypothetical protein